MKNLYPLHRSTVESIQTAAALSYPDAVLPAFARVLMLGCGTGEAAMVQGLAYPQSTVLGVDINDSLILSGQEKVQVLGLQNVALCSTDLNNLLASNLGKFDYIVVKGLFALLGGDERRALLSWCREHLEIKGVIAFNWQSLPGANVHKTLQDALCYHAAMYTDDEEKISAARGMLSYLAMTLAEGEFKQCVLLAEQLDDLTLAMRYLNNINQADYFIDFNERVNEVGLVVEGDVIPQRELPSYYGDSIERLHRVATHGRNSINAQQYLDFSTHRAERFSLLVHSSQQRPVASLTQESMQQLHWAGNFKRGYNDAGEMLNAYANAAGSTIRTQNTTILQVLDLLSEAWPLSLSFAQLQFHTHLPESPDNSHVALITSLWELFSKDIDGLFYVSSPSAYNHAEGEKLQLIICPEPSLFEENDEVSIFNYWGEAVTLSKAEWDFMTNEQMNEEKSWIHFCSLRNKGLLTGSTAAWRRAYQNLLIPENTDRLRETFPSLLLFSSEVKYGGFSDIEQHHSLSAAEEAANEDLYNTADSLLKRGLLHEADKFIAAKLEDEPENIQLLQFKARTCLLSGQFQASLNATCRVLGKHSVSWSTWLGLASVFIKTNDLLCSQRIVQALLRIEGENSTCWNLLASIYHFQREMALAEKCAREAVRYRANVPYYMAVLGMILSDNLKMDDARYYLEKSLEFKSLDFDTFSSLLFVMSHDSRVTAEELKDRHLEYGRRVSEWVAKQDVQLIHAGSKEPERKLRIGFVSADFRDHPVSKFFLPFWDNLDRDRFDLLIYSNSYKFDEISEHFRSTATIWHNITQMDNLQLAQQIHADQVDILFDLSGHTSGVRLPAFGFKPAPLQFTWLGYPGTTGLSQMDYRFTTPGFGEPGEMDNQHTEKLIYIPLRSFFRPSPLSPAVNELPALNNGYITYGSFNRPQKMNDAVFSAWAKILNQSPDSKIIIGFADDDKIISLYRKKLCALGVSEDKLLFRKTTGIEKYLHMHHEVDILLDSFPYNGGTTTCHGIWMGVPTLTLAGSTPASRQGAELMHLYGMGQFIAKSEQEYIDKALYWQDRKEELNTLRKNMRNNIPSGEKNDPEIVGSFEKALRQVWRNYCSGSEPISFTVAN
ncbi:methyltransferase [Cedecea neteri]|uniref:O-linked N-acetylglucosamine transferase family protein n=1 Tax=Cedecea neteri TaxID=158822 RepID=UPI002AA785A2|nr:methyltransferase domain-containing protein [Cedecea neteri]WPU24862.1 methyltransferase [Cedecea neteri]